jgi:hypothetical protein
MARTPEVAAKDRIKAETAKVLKRRQLPAKMHWNAGTGFGTSRLDFDGVIAGHPFYVEVKRFDEKGKLTGRQKSDLRDYAEAGAFTLLIDSEETLQLWLQWLEVLEPRRSFLWIGGGT